MSTSKQRAYAKKFNEITKRFSRMEDDTIKRAIRLLEDLRKQISDEIVQGGNTPFNAMRLQQLKANVSELIDGFESQIQALTSKSVSQAYNFGGTSVTEPAIAAGVAGVFYQPTPAQINVLIDFSADLIKGITDDMRQKINSSLTRGALGNANPLDVMKEITEILGTRAGKDVVKGVAARAEKIYRTELGRVYSISAQSQREKALELEPDLQKRWLSTGDFRTRDSHLAAHGQTVPVSDDFVVGGEKLAFPRDPKGSAGNTINCRCSSIAVWPEIGDIETLNDRRVNKEMERREQEE